MSSMLRRMEIRGMKMRGFKRLAHVIGKNSDGTMKLTKVARGGTILNPNGEPIGRRWPRASAA